jgi:hypothetical protein
MNAPPYLPLVALVLQDTVVPIVDRWSVVASVEHRHPKPLLRLDVNSLLR